METKQLQALSVANVMDEWAGNDRSDSLSESESESSDHFVRQNAHEAHLCMLETEKFTDVTFIVGKTKERVKCHSVFLMARSRIFQVMLRNRETKATEIGLVNADPGTFRLLLKFLYADVFPDTVTEALDLLSLGSKYKVEQLMEDSFIKLTWKMSPGNAIRVFKAAECYGLHRLKDAAGNVLVESLPTLPSWSDWVSLDELIWLYLLERDDHKLSEFQLFELLWKWGKSQLKDQDQDNVDQLPSVLTNLIPLIRFPVMTPQEFNFVVSTGLLSEKTAVQIFMYMSSTGEARETIARSLPFRTTPRRAVRSGSENTFGSCPFGSLSTFRFSFGNLGETIAKSLPPTMPVQLGILPVEKINFSPPGSDSVKTISTPSPVTTPVQIETPPAEKAKISAPGNDSQKMVSESLSVRTPTQIETPPAEKAKISAPGNDSQKMVPESLPVRTPTQIGTSPVERTKLPDPVDDSEKLVPESLAVRTPAQIRTPPVEKTNSPAAMVDSEKLVPESLPVRTPAEIEILPVEKTKLPTPTDDSGKMVPQSLPVTTPGKVGVPLAENTNCPPRGDDLRKLIRKSSPITTVKQIGVSSAVFSTESMIMSSPVTVFQEAEVPLAEKTNVPCVGNSVDTVTKSSSDIPTTDREFTVEEKTYVSFYGKKVIHRNLTKYSPAPLGEFMSFRFAGVRPKNSAGLGGTICLDFVNICWPEINGTKRVGQPLCRTFFNSAPEGKRRRYDLRDACPNLPNAPPIYNANQSFATPYFESTPSLLISIPNPSASNTPVLRDAIAPAAVSPPSIHKSFKLSVKQFSQSPPTTGRLRVNDFVTKFEAGGIDFKAGGAVTISLRPAVQLCEGETYYLCIEEVGTPVGLVQYRHLGKALPKESIEIQSKTWSATLSDIQRNDPTLLPYSSTPFGVVQLIQGIGIKLVDEQQVD